MKTEQEQFTISRPVKIDGVGLHTGLPATVTFNPAPVNSGIVFKRVDLLDAPSIPALVANVVDVTRGTSLGIGKTRIHTVEHLMAAIYGLGLTNMEIHIAGEEPPACDGSARLFVEILDSAGKTSQQESVEICRLHETFGIRDNDKSIVYLPSDNLEITFTLEYQDGLIPLQTFHAVIDERFFRDRLSKARTFGFVREFEMFREKNLARGGSLENAVVIRDDGTLLNPEGKRDDHEFVLHKILDLVGDLALTGKRIKGHIVANKTGHAYNIRFAKKLQELNDHLKKRNGNSMMTIEEIKTVLPHRYPFLLVDRIVSIDPGKSAVGIKNVTANEEFFSGHFPDKPIMPGVLILEAAAQVAGVLFLSEPENKGKTPLFCGIDKIRFRRLVVPGDRLELFVNTLKVRGNTGKVAVEAKVEGELVTSGEFMFTIV